MKGKLMFLSRKERLINKSLNLRKSLILLGDLILEEHEREVKLRLSRRGVIPPIETFYDKYIIEIILVVIGILTFISLVCKH